MSYTEKKVQRTWMGLVSFLAYLAQYKRDVSSVLHVYMSPATWPNDPGSAVILVREIHWFEPDTFHRLIVSAK